MSREPETVVLKSWPFGRKALVSLVQDGEGDRYIVKKYRARYFLTMIREALALSYLAKRHRLIPRLLRIGVFRLDLYISYAEGVRVREWVIDKFVPAGCRDRDQPSPHLLESDPVVMSAFSSFRECKSEESTKLKDAIRRSYRDLHMLGWIHGSADPRNIIYDGTDVYIIDFDHARPCFGPVAKEAPGIESWYGVQLGLSHAGD
jgi:tRNA A-37 threonylcarbamoyl transferase component Bud32